MNGKDLSETPLKRPTVTGRRYWRSLNELADKPAFRDFVEREFPKHASEWLGNGETRRGFLKVMGASLALAGLASCRRWPDEKLAPYAHRPANRMDGVPVHYATAYETAGMGAGVLAVSFDGRPIKVDGNPTHPLTRGTSDVYLQASVLNVYDPDRSRGVTHGGKEASWEAFADAWEKAELGDGTGVVVLSEISRSPSVAAMTKAFKAKYPKAAWHEYEVLCNDNQRAGLNLFAGRPLRAVPALDQAQVIVSIDADLFHGEPLAIKYNRDFSNGRKLRDSSKSGSAQMNRLYVVESGYTITGSMADHRRAARPSEIPSILRLIAGRMGVAGMAADKTALSREIQDFADALVADAKGKKAVFVAGHRQPAEVHAAVAAINAAIAAPVEYFAETDDPRTGTWSPATEQIKNFAAAAAGASAVIVIGANPVLTAPVDLSIGEVIKRAKLSIHLGGYEDETAKACQWHLPQAHYLEAWGDVRTFNGAVSIAQPLIYPIFGGKSTIELLSLLLGEEPPAPKPVPMPVATGPAPASAPASAPAGALAHVPKVRGREGYDIVRAVAATYIKDFSDWNWKKSLFEGVVAGSEWKAEAVAADPAKTSAALGALGTWAGAANGLELALFAGALHDGRYANNGWLQEMPDPMTRVSWENPILISPATAKQFNIDSDDVVRLTANGQSIEGPVYVLPGHPDQSLSIAMGYGRDYLGSISDGIGCNAFFLRSSKDAGGGAFVANVTLDRKNIEDKQAIVACVQDHHTIDTVGRNRVHKIVPELVVEGVFEEYKKKPALGTRKMVQLSMFNEHTYNPGDPWVMAKWGMAIDLTVCTGCSACVIACQAENNVPIVGKEMVYRGREMHWLRIDRYYKWGKSSEGDVSEMGDPQVVHQPILCMHCENAPCEEVCPVGATTHSHEGLNMMTYNRCIGTRYCSNNCPYKVRRFNFFDYNAGTKDNLYRPNLLRDDLNELVKMQKNPQVTVRSRGVMEKCTYCVQRIEAARIKLRAENRAKADNMQFEDGTVVTACQQACPTDAIVFGDLNQDGKDGRKLSRVAAMHQAAQSYGLLDPELNTKPRTQYLAKVRNPSEGLDHNLYNEYTATKGNYWDETEGEHMEAHPAEAHDAPAPASAPAKKE